MNLFVSLGYYHCKNVGRKKCRRSEATNINRSAVFIALCLIFDIYSLVPTHMRVNGRRWRPIKKERFFSFRSLWIAQPRILFAKFIIKYIYAKSIEYTARVWCLMPVMRVTRIFLYYVYLYKFHIDRLLERTRADVFFLIVEFSLLAFGGYNDRCIYILYTTTITSTPIFVRAIEPNTPNCVQFYIHEIIPASIECACAPKTNTIERRKEPWTYST